MARATPIMQKGNAGEFTPLLEGFVGLDRYASAWRTLENMIPLVQGPVTRRPGTRFVKEVKDSDDRTSFVTFEFSTTQAYMIEAGDQYFRFYKDKARIVVANTDAAITNGSFASNITGWTDASAGGTAAIAHDATNGRMTLTPDASNAAAARQSVAVTSTFQAAEHVLAFRVVGSRGDKLRLRVGTSSGGTELINDKECLVGWHLVAFTPGATTFYVEFRALPTDQAKAVQLDDVRLLDNAPLELATPYTQANLFDGDERCLLKWSQSADILWLQHPSYFEYSLSRTGHTSWSLTQVLHTDGPYLDENTDTTKTLTPSAATGNGITLTAAGFAPFLATHVGRAIRIKQGSVWGWVVIVGYTSETVVTVDVKSTLTDTTAKSAWRLGVWNDETGHPGCSTFHEERLVRAGAGAKPNRFDASKTGDFDNFAPGTADADAIAYSVGANQVVAIKWLAALKDLIIGSVSGLFRVGTDSVGAPLSPTNANVRRQTRRGVADMPVLPVDDVGLFVQRQGRKVREAAFNIESDGYKAPDLTLLAAHVTGTGAGILSWAYQEEPWSIVWCARADGQLIALTYERDEQVVAWHRHPLGGAFGSGDPVVEAVATIPGDGEDEVWLIVKRTIDGATKRYIEILDPDFAADADQEDAFFVDCGLTYSGSAATTISNLDHLEGATVKVLGNGAVLPDEVVASGAITLDAAVTKAQIGLGSTWTAKPQRFEAGAEYTAQGKNKRISHLMIRFYRSLGVTFGPSADKLDPGPFRKTSDVLGSPPPLFSGDMKVPFRGSTDRDGAIVLSGDAPLPATIVSIVPRFSVDDD